jgi:hypothetical protein
MSKLNPADNNKYDKLLRILFILGLLLGLSVRFYQYFMGRSLWEDETHLALNFMKYDFTGLAKPLDEIQAAPILFLYTVKLFAIIFGYGEKALRALPFICNILTFPLFYYIVRELTKSRIAALIGFLVFSVNLALIYFSSELKTYGVDVAVYLLITYLTISKHNYVVKNRNILLAAAGCFSLLYSNVAFIVLACSGFFIVLQWYNKRRVNWKDVLLFLSWGAVFTINYFLFIHNHPHAHDQKQNYAFAFLPTDVFSPEFITFVDKRIEEIFFSEYHFSALLYIPHGYYFPYVLLLVFIIALGHILLKKEYAVFIFAVLPILLHLGLSALEQYPFWFRLILYLVPCFIILISLGTYLIGRFIARKTHLVAGGIFVIGCCIFYVKKNIEKFPLWPLEIKPSLNYVDKNFPAGTHIYITTPINAYKYYQQLGVVKTDFYKRAPWEMGPEEYYFLTAEEKSNYILFYGSSYPEFGYRPVIEDLLRRNLIVRSFEYKGYIVSEVRPFALDSGVTVKVIDYTSFKPEQVLAEDKTMPMWGNGDTVAQSIFLQKGRYNISIVSSGSPAAGEYPHNNLFINGAHIGDFISKRLQGKHTFSFELQEDRETTIKISMDNDASINNEDRNTFVRKIIINKE